jgi:hypothetical protein
MSAEGADLARSSVFFGGATPTPRPAGFAPGPPTRGPVFELTPCSPVSELASRGSGVRVDPLWSGVRVSSSRPSRWLLPISQPWALVVFAWSWPAWLARSRPGRPSAHPQVERNFCCATPPAGMTRHDLHSHWLLAAVDINHSIGAHRSSDRMVHPNGSTVCPRSLLITSRQRQSCLDYRSPVWISTHPSDVHLDVVWPPSRTRLGVRLGEFPGWCGWCGPTLR